MRRGIEHDARLGWHKTPAERAWRRGAPLQPRRWKGIEAEAEGQKKKRPGALCFARACPKNRKNRWSLPQLQNKIKTPRDADPAQNKRDPIQARRLLRGVERTETFAARPRVISPCLLARLRSSTCPFALSSQVELFGRTETRQKKQPQLPQPQHDADLRYTPIPLPDVPRSRYRVRPSATPFPAATPRQHAMQAHSFENWTQTQKKRKKKTRERPVTEVPATRPRARLLPSQRHAGLGYGFLRLSFVVLGCRERAGQKGVVKPFASLSNNRVFLSFGDRAWPISARHSRGSVNHRGCRRTQRYTQKNDFLGTFGRTLVD